MAASAGRRVPDDELRVAQLLVSELVTNVVKHARSEALLNVTLGEDEICVEVVDRAPTRTPVERHPRLLDEGGRGLSLVSALATDWGVKRDDQAKCVWFVLRSEAEHEASP